MAKTACLLPELQLDLLWVTQTLKEKIFNRKIYLFLLFRSRASCYLKGRCLAIPVGV